jgi:Tetratricopeptide repeat
MVEDGNHARTDLRLFIALSATGLLFALGAVLPRNPDFDALLGAEAFRRFGLTPLLAALGVLLGLFAVPGLLGRLGGLLATVGSRIPRVLRVLLLLAVFLPAFWFLPMSRISGDSLPVMLRACAGDAYASNALTSWLFIGTSRLLDIPGPTAIRLVSCLAGAVYILAAVGIGRVSFPAGPARAGLTGLLVTTGTAALFFGSIEVYAPVAAAVAVYVYLGLRVLNGKGRILWPGLALGVAFGLHGSAGLLFPSLYYLANGAVWRPKRILKVAGAGLMSLIPIGLTFLALYFFQWGGGLPEAGPSRYGTFLGGMNQAPVLPLLLTPVNVLHRYAILDAEHFVGVLNLIFLVAPVGVLLLLSSGFRKRDSAFRFVLTVAAFLVAFPFFWNINYSLRLDWELFAPMGIPVTLLGGLAFLHRRGDRGNATGVVLLSLLAFIPLLLTNYGTAGERRQCLEDIRTALTVTVRSLPPTETARLEIARAEAERVDGLIRRLDPHDVIGNTTLAITLIEKGREREAEAVLREVLAAEPDLFRAQEPLGGLLLKSGRPDEARPLLIRCLIGQPWRISARMNLARIAFKEGDRAAAIRHVEKGLRSGSNAPLAGRALYDLSRLREENREVETARILLEMSRAKGFTPPSR